MLKKMVILAVVGFVAVTVLAGTKIGSYLRSEINSARERAEESIPPEQEISRLRHEVKQLDKGLMVVVNQLAKERVEVNQLDEKVKTNAAAQEKDKALLTSRAQSIKDATAQASTEATAQVKWGNRTLSVSAAKAELDTDVKRFATNQKTLEAMEATLAHRIKIRDSLEKQLETMKNQKSELSIAIDGLEAELNVLKLQQMESKYQTDETRLAKIKEDMRKLKTRVEVEREKLKLMPKAIEEPAPETNSKSVDDIMAPLTGKPAAPKTNTTVPIVD
jgi:chromosome segregation ATPase